jgi:kynureninase
MLVMGSKPSTQSLVVPARAAATDRARTLDELDALASFRERFIDDEQVVYLDGNSLGRLPRSTAARLERVVRSEWGNEVVRGWNHWLDAAQRVGDLIGEHLIGAAADQTLVSDSTTVNIYKLAAAALAARPGRKFIVATRDEFPTDRYVLEGLAGQLGLTMRWLDTDPIDGPSLAELDAAIDSDVALVALSLVNYRSAVIADLPGVTELARSAGALVIWDLCHAVGAIPIDLDAAGVDLAVGCTYKYLNAGPGAPAFLYVRRERQAELHNPIQGWFGQRDQFAMGPRYDPAPGIRSWLTGTPGILALAAVEEGVLLTAEAGMAAIRQKSVALTAFCVELVDDELAPLGCLVGSPRDAAKRGSHVSIRHPDAKRLTAELIERGVIPDFREPDSIRFGMPPLTTSFADVARGVERLAEILRQR